MTGGRAPRALAARAPRSAESCALALVFFAAGCAAPTPRARSHAERAAAAETETETEPETAREAPEARDRHEPAEAPRDEREVSETPAPPADEREPIEVLTGRASFYADRFHGRPTASGEPYDMHALTAASRDLPFGTVVRVVRLDTGASVVVRVNDRGPFRDHRRILDLSRAAAEALDMVRAGVIEIRAEILERGDGRRVRAGD